MVGPLDRSMKPKQNGDSYVRLAAWILLPGLLAVGGCVEEQDLTLPTDQEVEASFQYGGELRAEMSGNVAVVTVSQPYRQVRRGGNIWVKTGPYVVLFSQQTQDLFLQYGGLAAVRVITQTGSGQEVARATLLRDGLNELTWKRALNVSGHARLEGTTRPTRLEDLIKWGEEHTEFEYNPRYIVTR